MKKCDSAESKLDQSILFEGLPKGSRFFFGRNFISVCSAGKREIDESKAELVWLGEEYTNQVVH